jgi:hypothetical protein
MAAVEHEVFKPGAFVRFRALLRFFRGSVLFVLMLRYRYSAIYVDLRGHGMRIM